ncbi:MAG: tetratricopeptide repeat protein, partial [Candidatus Aminicenantes bacterium]|nr:tetratricopeptide repeat protein [Candidatus Aminicenantes bacterium]
EAFGEHGEFGHQVFCYQENLRVPLLFHAPGFLPAGLRLETRACLSDVMPTILDYLGLPLPAGIQGRSLLPAMRGERIPDRELYLESFFAREAFRCSPVMGILRGDFKYLDLPKPELYDLAQDPGEKKNLVSAAAARAQEMKAALRALARRLDGGIAASGRRLSEAEAKTLATLGYITSGPAGETGERFPDPKDKIAGWQLFTRGSQQAAAGQSAEAAASLQQAIEILPDYAGSYTVLANVHFKEGRREEALELLRRAMARLPRDTTLKSEYASLLIEMKRLDEARVQLQELVAMGVVDKKAHVHSQLGSISEASGDNAGAIAHYRLAYECEPENRSYARKLAFLLHSANRFAEALEVYRELERRDPDDIQLIRDMAIVYAQLNDLDRSQRYFARALQRAPDANLYFNYALLLARRGDMAAAASMMERFLAVAPPGSAQSEAGRRHLESWRRR